MSGHQGTTSGSGFAASSAGAAPADAPGPESAGNSFIAQLAGAGAGDLAPEPTRRRFGGVGLIVCAVVIGAGGLLGMRQLGMGAHVSFAKVKIDYDLEAASATAADSDPGEVLTALRESGDIAQVPLDDIQMNPFAWNGFAETNKQADTAGPTPEDLSRRVAEERRRQVSTALSRLTLNSVVGGSTPVARISGQLVRVGETVGEFFTVSAISGRRVDLVADGETYSLSIGEP